MKECYLCGYELLEDEEIVTADCDGEEAQVHRECCEAHGISYMDEDGDGWYPDNNYREPNPFDVEVDEEGADA
jgi:hypothetical protein